MPLNTLNNSDYSLDFLPYPVTPHLHDRKGISERFASSAMHIVSLGTIWSFSGDRFATEREFTWVSKDHSATIVQLKEQNINIAVTVAKKREKVSDSWLNDLKKRLGDYMTWYKDYGFDVNIAEHRAHDEIHEQNRDYLKATYGFTQFELDAMVGHK